MELKEFLRWAVSGGGAGVLAYWLLSKWPWFGAQAADRKRYVSIAVTFLLADVLWLALVFAGYDAMPVGVLGWVEQLFLVGTSAFGLSQVIHGARDLRAGDK
ncbi:MAG: hypothetical protein BWY25_02990 [Chloroflexi bacterium ADurb.Bin222]|nr:MAG: hypothetical protein BWY25_02990 [Chloroflexi bacterium ADurb.Bin222]